MEANTLNLPVLALRGLTVFPHMTLTFDVERPISIAAWSGPWRPIRTSSW